jgi:hypothetical protein
MRGTLLPSPVATPHVDLALAEAALPREQAQQGQDGALNHSVSRKTAEVEMAASGTGPQLDLEG